MSTPSSPIGSPGISPHGFHAADEQGGPGPGRATVDGRGHRLRGLPAGPSSPSRSPMSLPASSPTWSRNEAFARPPSIRYRYHLDRFQAYLQRIGVRSVQELSPVILSSHIVERAASGLARSTVREDAGVLRVFLRYLHREGVLATDLSDAVGWPQVYRMSTIPRSISWDEVNQVLAGVDRRTPAGRRDYAILLLLVTYGLRAREVAALTLDDIDWKHDRLAVPERKANHSTAFPLSPVVGEAILDYLRNGRPETTDRHVFFRAVAPHRPIGPAAVSSRARHYLLQAGVQVPRPGSHTLRHSAVQRLVDANLDLKTIGDFIGHRSPRSTEVYAKVDVEALRAGRARRRRGRAGDERRPDHRGVRLPRPQKGSRPQVSDRGGNAAAAAGLRRPAPGRAACTS